MQEKEKLLQQEEMKGVTFQPEVKRRKGRRLAKYVDPKKYLNPDPKSAKYSDQFRKLQRFKDKKNSNQGQRKMKHSMSIHCMPTRGGMHRHKGSKSYTNLQIDILTEHGHKKSKKTAAHKGKRKVINLPSPTREESSAFKVNTSSVEESNDARLDQLLSDKISRDSGEAYHHIIHEESKVEPDTEEEPHDAGDKENVSDFFQKLQRIKFNTREEFENMSESKSSSDTKSAEDEVHLQNDATKFRTEEKKLAKENYYTNEGSNFQSELKDSVQTLNRRELEEVLISEEPYEPDIPIPDIVYDIKYLEKDFYDFVDKTFN